MWTYEPQPDGTIVMTEVLQFGDYRETIKALDALDEGRAKRVAEELNRKMRDAEERQEHAPEQPNRAQRRAMRRRG